MITEKILDLLFPLVCQGCGLEGVWLCLSCQEGLEPPRERCLSCNEQSFQGITHEKCESRAWALRGLMVAGDYHHRALEKLIWNMKYNSIESIGKTLALLLTDYLIKRDLLEYFSSAVVIPVPLHKRRKRWRGFNQAEIMAKEFCRLTGLEYRDILVRTKNSKRQVDLERDERIQNVEGLFRCPPLPELGERKIILIDDVATTGATLNECAKQLRTQQVGEIWALVAARN